MGAEKFFAVLDSEKRVIAWYSDRVHGAGIPAEAVEVDADERAALLAANAAAVLDTAAPKGARVVPVAVPVPVLTKAERLAADLGRAPLVAALVEELAARFAVTPAALRASIAGRLP